MHKQKRDAYSVARRITPPASESPVSALLAVAMTLAFTTASASEDSAGPSWRVAVPDLRVDANRDGRIDLRGMSDEDLESSREALFLPNLDDDADRCAPGSDLFKDVNLDKMDPEIDRQLLACNDAQDNVVNGIRDELDLARIRAVPIPDAADGATIVLGGAPTGTIRLFLRDGDQLRAFNPTTEKVPAQALRTGLELRLESRDIVRDSTWSGAVRVTLRLPNGASDTVRLRQAPLLLQHTLQRSQRVMLNTAKTPLSREEFEELYKDLPEYRYEDYLFFITSANMGYREFRKTLEAARRSAGVIRGLKELDSNGDRWTQDVFEPAYSSVPGPGGKPHVMRMVIRSSQPWRAGGRVAFRLRGPDIGVVQQFTTDLPPVADSSLSSLGNLDAVPAHIAHGTRYPNGRILLGSSDSRQPDPSFAAMLAAQKAQPLLTIDTSWLLVGHVDEILQVVPAHNRRGWTLAVPDPRGAVALLRAAAAKGAGATKLFEGQPQDPYSDGSDPETIDQVLAHVDLMAQNERAAQHLDRVLTKLLDDLDLDESELVKLPVLFRLFSPTIFEPLTNGTDTSGQQFMNGSPPTPTQKLLGFNQNLMLSELEAAARPQEGLKSLSAKGTLPERYYAWSPNLANGLLLSAQPAEKDLAESGNREAPLDWVFAYTNPHGPVVDGKDIFAQAAVEALSHVGVRPFDIDAWIWAHNGQGEVHCTTNVWRDVYPDAAWWRIRR